MPTEHVYSDSIEAIRQFCKCIIKTLGMSLNRCLSVLEQKLSAKHVEPEAGVISIQRGGTLVMMIAIESTAKQTINAEITISSWHTSSAKSMQ